MRRGDHFLSGERLRPIYQPLKFYTKKKNEFFLLRPAASQTYLDNRTRILPSDGLMESHRPQPGLLETLLQDSGVHGEDSPAMFSVLCALLMFYTPDETRGVLLCPGAAARCNSGSQSMGQDPTMGREMPREGSSYQL